METLPESPQHHKHVHNFGFFHNADHTTVFGGNFTTVTNITNIHERDNGFSILQSNVATAAFHSSKQRLDPPRCHAHTREAVLAELLEWIEAPHNIRTAWIAWLSGAAGAGKSAVCQSIAEMCKRRGARVASFFFFRADRTRNTVDALAATLAYQLIQLLPAVKPYVVEAVEGDPLIFEQAFEDQLEVLIVAPLRRLLVSDPSWTLLLVIDGVDECVGESTQMMLVQTFARLLSARDLPLIVLFASRRENQLQMAFSARDMTGILKELQLDNNYQSHADIQRFLDDSFEQIKRTHPFSRRLAPAWPPLAHVQEIVKKSSGQFIFAAVVIKFVSSPKANPATQLEIVRGLRPAGRATPFAELDALYMHILSQVEDIQPVLELLAYTIFCGAKLSEMLYFFQLAEDDAEVLLAPLTSVITLDSETDMLRFLHASLPDFLKSRERSGAYCISELGTHLAILWFDNAAAGRFQDFPGASRNVDLGAFLALAQPDLALRTCISEFDPWQTPTIFMAYTYFADDILDGVSHIDFGDGGEAYRTLLGNIVRFLRKEQPEKFDEINIDIADIMEAISKEEEQQFLSLQ
ncbi:hypothetical protein HYPSUDRAFT_42533 [Hypholoma sublateritium FD-334 SS-4]|uniref:NACHT domain-containing protein n=1 Tax=Hypholoma sublateritium (strain FD-334 SS-4) TaxID=945553 RepID=A0A0D2MBW9_HYPSF|nr:hypothetical protein HYPSUDRAFT_42533 [Hypholoma sublateritium FD-334 SS-4]